MSISIKTYYGHININIKNQKVIVKEEFSKLVIKILLFIVLESVKYHS